MLAYEQQETGTGITFQDNILVLDSSGCLYWPDENLLVVSDLHLEKGSSFASRKGMFLPPYDTQTTLEMLALCITRFNPGTVISLGDSFHDAEASVRLPNSYRLHLAQLMTGRDWIWVYGNHDPFPPEELGGTYCESLQVGNLNFLHEPLANFRAGEIAGHLHPCAKIRKRGKSVRRRCFAGDADRLIMPAFGSFTGGLNIRDEAYKGLFEPASMTAWMLSKDQVFEISGKDCVA